MQQSVLTYMADLVAAGGSRVFPTRRDTFSSSDFNKYPEAQLIESLYKELGGKGNCWNISFSLPDGIESELHRLTVDGSLQFNRYRAITLKSPLYERYNPGWLETYRRNCRTLERECLKDGSRLGVWTNRLAEEHFGEAQETGDFFGNGASGWKFQAFREFLADFALFKSRQTHKRISEHERLMVQGNLIPLKQLLLSRNDYSRQYLAKFLGRQLEVELKQEQE